jgi:hypothetical protein
MREIIFQFVLKDKSKVLYSRKMKKKTWLGKVAEKLLQIQEVGV